MKHRAILVCILAALALLGGIIVPAGAGQEPQAPGASTNAKLQMYEAVVDPATAETIVSGGYDVVTIEAAAGEQVRLVLVLYPWERQALEKLGVELQLWTNDSGLSATQLAAKQARAGFKVWRDYDDPTRGFEAYMENLAASSPLVELHQIGTTYGFNAGDSPGPLTPRPIYALKVEKDADTDPDGDDPAVLYSSLQHAREWISSELNRRLLEWYLKRYREGDPQIRNLLSTTELWFVLVTNPDGYQYTFDPEGDRLWRKNLADNDLDLDGIVDFDDGVDPNRNFPEHWGYDDEGSSSAFSSETYRGPLEASEPETQAMMAVYALAEDPVFHVNYHSFGELLLYSFGFQVQTPSADDPIFVALSGTDKKPAIQHFNPGVGADLYITNGETTDWAHGEMGTLAWTPELSEGPNGDGFIFPDSEGAIGSEFKKNLPFALDVALSATDPDDPVSHKGFSTEPFYLDVSEVDPQKAHNPLSDFSFAYSYGSPQPVEILAKRDLNDDGAITSADDVFVHWSVEGGEPQSDPDPLGDWDGGDRFGEFGDEYYRIVRGEVSGFSDGDSVEVWFTGGGHTSDSFTFESVTTEPNRVLILAAEDYSGAANIPAYASTTAPNYLTYYEDSLETAGYTTDVYDVDARGRIAPDHLGVLSHYDAVVWYGANDYLTREPGQTAGTGASTLANAEVLEVRSYLNEGGALLYSGVHAGWQFYNAFEYNPVSTPPYCDGTVPNSTGVECLLLSDDFHQYWLGGYLFIEDGGTNPGTLAENTDDTPFGIDGVAGGAFDGQSWTLNDGTSADNHQPNQVRGTTFSLLTTSSLLPPDTYPQFTSRAQAVWDTGLAGAFSPLSEPFYVYSDRGDVSYKRLVAELDVPASGDTTLEFSISYDTEPAWDFVFVEARTPDGSDYVTLPDLNGHTSSSTGDSCPEGWHELHPHLALYQGADCSGTGWNAASGRSSGWEEWSVDLAAWAGEDVEVSISYASDWAIQGLGAFVDDIDAPGATGDTDFESGLGIWEVKDGTELGSAPNPNEWFRTEDVGFEEGAAVSMTPPGAPWRTLYLAFGFEGITSQAQRDAVMADAMAYLLPGP